MAPEQRGSGALHRHTKKWEFPTLYCYRQVWAALIGQYELGLNFSAKLTFAAANGVRTANFDQNNDLVMSYRQLHGWILLPLVFCAVGAH